MKIIEAFVNPSQVGPVRAALCKLGVENLNVRSRRPEFPRGNECKAKLPREIRIEFAVGDNQAEDAVTAIVNSTLIIEMGADDTFASRIGDAIHIHDQGQTNLMNESLDCVNGPGLSPRDP